MLVAAGVAAALAGVLAGAAAAVRAALRMGLALALPDRRRQRPRRQPRRDGAGPARRLAAAAARSTSPPRRSSTASSSACARSVVMVAFAVYSACVDPDRVLRALRPLAGRSALTATLVSRLVPVAAADAARLRDAARCAAPAPPRSAAAPLARRLLAGSLDRAVDVAATLELRGYGLDAPRRAAPRASAPATTRRFYARRRRWSSPRRSPAKAPRRRRLPHLPDDRARPRPGHPRPRGPARPQRPGAVARRKPTAHIPRARPPPRPGRLRCLSWRSAAASPRRSRSRR